MIQFRRTAVFDKNYKRLERKYPSLKEDFGKLALSLIDNPNQGIVMADNFRKIRLSIKSKGKGKSGGARIITINCLSSDNDGIITLLSIYDKSDMDSITIKELREIWENEKKSH